MGIEKEKADGAALRLELLRVPEFRERLGLLPRGHELTQAEIRAVTGLSKTRVGQIERTALRKMR